MTWSSSNYFFLSGGRRGNITLNHILQFATGGDEEPPLGYAMPPALHFVDAEKGFLPTANICINCLKIPRGSIDNQQPADQLLFNLYDFAFANTYFGVI